MEEFLGAGSVTKLRHSLGLVATSATALLSAKEKNSLDFVRTLWNAKLESCENRYFDPYYGGLPYSFSLLPVSGKYRIIKPQAK